MPLAAYPAALQSCPQPARAGHPAWAGCWVFEVLQVFIAFMLLGLGSTLFFASSNQSLCIAYGYPLWGAVLYVVTGYFISSTATDPLKQLASCGTVSSCLSFLGSLVGVVLLTLDVIHISSPNLFRGSFVSLLHCEKSGVPAKHCHRLLVYELGLLVLLLILTVFEIILSSLALSYSTRHESEAHLPMQQLFPVPEPVAGPDCSQAPSALPPPYSEGNISLSPQGV